MTADGAAKVSTVWGRSVERFRGLVRFAPVWVCRRCNDGDGWAKAEGWCGLPSPIYPPSFSMTLPELELMRVPKDGTGRRFMAEAIWRWAEADHEERQAAVLAEIDAIVVGWRSGRPAFPRAAPLPPSSRPSCA